MTFTIRPQAAVAARIVLVGTLAFLVLGVPDGGDGVAWPFMRAALHQPLEALGLLSAAVTAGAVAMSAVSGRLTRRLGPAVLLVAACALCLVALLGIALSPAWATTVISFLVYGAGGGILDAVVQAQVVTRHGLRSMGAIHAGYGAGVTAGPLLMTGIITAGAGWRAGYACMAVLYAVLAATFARTWRAWSAGDRAPEHGAAAGTHAVRRLGVSRSLLLFFLVTGLETAAGLWAFTFLTGARGLGTAAAGVAVGAFFAVQTASRVALAIAGHRVEAATVLLAACVAVLGGASLMLVLPGAVSLAGLLLSGSGIGALYPSLMVAASGGLESRRAQSVVGYQVAAANAGATTGVAGTGLVLAHAGVGTLPATQLALAAVVVALLFARPRSVH